MQSGSPFTVTSGVDTNADGTTNDRVNVIGNPYVQGQHLSRARKISMYINPAAFAAPVQAPDQSATTNPYGNEQKNQFFGPANVNTNLSALKDFAVTEKVRLQFRAESFNVLNNVNLGNPRTVLTNLQAFYGSTSAQSGVINSAGDPRRLQFAVKILY